MVNSRLSIFVAAGAFLIGACDSPRLMQSEEVDLATTQAQSAGPATQISGQGQIIFDEKRRTFAVQAERSESGEISGEFQLINRDLDAKVHGKITCFTIEGDVAWMGGEITQSRGLPAGFPDDEAAWRLQDNGTPGSSPSDRLSTAFAMEDGEAQPYCNNQPNTPVLQEILSGNIDIR